jgi:O-antigen/teichoic acid export membrane protein
LLNTPLSVVQSLNANMQAAYGEAIGSNDHVWISSTVKLILKQTLILLCFLVAGFTTVSRPMVELWTSGRIIIGEAMQWSVVGIASCFAINSIFRFALSGMNRHRVTGIIEIVFGVLALGLCSIAIRFLGVGYIGLGVVVAYVLTCGWILPRELSRQLGHERLVPDLGFFVRLLSCTALAVASGKLLAIGLSSQPKALIVVIAGSVAAVAFMLALRWLLRDEYGRLFTQFYGYWIRIRNARRSSKWTS